MSATIGIAKLLNNLLMYVVLILAYFLPRNRCDICFSLALVFVEADQPGLDQDMLVDGSKQLLSCQPWFQLH